MPMNKSLSGNRGFTLIEIMIVVAIVGILASLAQPMFKNAVTKARESALKENLYNMRSAIDQFWANNGRYPDSLDELVDKEYMRRVPKDPITRTDEWDLEYYGGDEFGEGAGGIVDVHSTSGEEGLNGIAYSEW